MTAPALPEFDSPAVGFEQPFEMLEACHERVRRSLVLLERLIGHVEAHGHDARSRSAAADVLRYFDLAAPLHHQDEERHVFALLEHCGDAALEASTAGLRSDHARMEALWALLRVALGAWAMPGAREAASALSRQQAQSSALCTPGTFGPRRRWSSRRRARASTLRGWRRCRPTCRAGAKLKRARSAHLRAASGTSGSPCRPGLRVPSRCCSSRAASAGSS